MKEPNKYKLLTIIALIVFTSCSAIYEDGKEMANEYRKQIKHISATELNKKIENANEFLLIDCRQHNEYLNGNITGSFNVVRGELEFNILNDFFWEKEYMYTPYKTDTIIIYCKSGNRATLATRSLMQLGFENVYNLDGGWIAYNGGIEPENNTSSSGGCGN